jgi:hypothetical protein
VIPARLDTLVVARLATLPAKSRARGADLAATLQRFAPLALTPPAFRDAVEAAVAGLGPAVDAGTSRPIAGELARRLGGPAPKTWRALADRVLPALGLGVAAGDAKVHARLASRDDWAAAIAARALGLWTAGVPPRLPAACDALVWRELALPGTPRACPPEVRACFVQRRLGVDPAPPERLVRLFAARAIDAPRSEPRALRDALVRGWLAGRVVGDDFAASVRAAAAGAQGFGARKAFIAAVWDALRARGSALSLDDVKRRLVEAHRAGELELARADLVAAMDPALVAASEIVTDGATYHFVVREEPR